MSKEDSIHLQKNPVDLTEDEEKLRDQIQDGLNKIKEQFRNHKSPERDSIYSLGELAAQLHAKLSDRGINVKHHKYMIENRRKKPDHPDFYKHVHPVEDLLLFLEDQSANDDPEDQTINTEFKFEVFSRRWGHEDEYEMVRIANGWRIRFNETVVTGRDGRVGGEAGTGLLEFLDHDSINYPEELPGYLEWLWQQAEEKGLSAEEVQEGLTTLANWVSLVEQNSPTGLFRYFK